VSARPGAGKSGGLRNVVPYRQDGTWMAIKSLISQANQHVFDQKVRHSGVFWARYRRAESRRGAQPRGVVP